MSHGTLGRPDLILSTLADEAAAFEADLAPLSENDLEQPSACTEWTVGDVVGHLTWAGPYFAAIIERALRGDTSLPIDLPPPGETRRQRIADLARETHAQAGGSLRQAFHEANQRVAAALGKVGPDDWDRPTAHRIGAIRLVAATRVNELALHGWDIRSVLRPPGHLRAESLPLLHDILVDWVPVLYRSDPAQTRPVVLRFAFTDLDLPARDLVLGANPSSFGSVAAEEPDLLLTGPAEVAPLFLLRRIDDVAAQRDYGLELEGNSAALDVLRARSGAF